MVVINLNQQSDSADLLGGFKPVEIRSLCAPLKEKFVSLFNKTFSKSSNKKFIEQLNQSYIEQKWKRFLTLISQAMTLVEKKIQKENESSISEESRSSKRKMEKGKKDSKPISVQLREEWKKFSLDLEIFETQKERISNNFAFSFVEGSLVKAVQSGKWVLLDEINLASGEMLESLSGLLEGGSLCLSERGDVEAVDRHPQFRLFACMNPPNDVGKKDLPPGLRNRFTEIFVDELEETDDLRILVSSYFNDTGK